MTHSDPLQALRAVLQQLYRQVDFGVPPTCTWINERCREFAAALTEAEQQIGKQSFYEKWIAAELRADRAEQQIELVTNEQQESSDAGDKQFDRAELLEQKVATLTATLANREAQLRGADLLVNKLAAENARLRKKLAEP